MEIKKTIPTEIYKKIYDAIIAAADAHGIESIDDNCFHFTYEDEDWSIEGTASLSVEWIDDSFDHAFGTEHCGHLEHRFDEMPDIEEIYVYDSQENEVEFDFDKFYTQFDITECKLYNGHVVKKGDEVIVRSHRTHIIVIFDHHNTETREWFCRCIFGGKVNEIPYRYDSIIPATEKNKKAFQLV